MKERDDGFSIVPRCFIRLMKPLWMRRLMRYIADHPAGGKPSKADKDLHPLFQSDTHRFAAVVGLFVGTAAFAATLVLDVLGR